MKQSFTPIPERFQSDMTSLGFDAAQIQDLLSAVADFAARQRTRHASGLIAGRLASIVRLAREKDASFEELMKYAKREARR